LSIAKAAGNIGLRAMNAHDLTVSRITKIGCGASFVIADAVSARGYFFLFAFLISSAKAFASQRFSATVTEFRQNVPLLNRFLLAFDLQL
jgi:hypothetical protein